MDLMHRIIAMHNGKIIRVECRTCNGHHNYRRPKSAAPEPRAATGRIASPRAPAAGGMSPRKAAAAELERQREQTWEKAVLGQPIAAFKAYRATQTFNQGELVRHGKFGDGYIARVIDKQKVEVMFKDGPRTLAQALEG
jgi:hypothetical protein